MVTFAENNCNKQKRALKVMLQRYLLGHVGMPKFEVETKKSI